ncbi:MAG: hypothetical protein Kow0059_00010 [Candidatus Sumerlaeia bacterium]
MIRFLNHLPVLLGTTLWCVAALPAEAQNVLPPGWANGPVPYDLNNDGVFDVQDVKFAAAIVIGRELTDQEADVNHDNQINAQDIIHLSRWVVDGTPTPTPTPTPSPTPGADTFNIEDYFILTQNSEWDYRADPGASPEDDFNWTITGTRQSPDNQTITPINYIVLDPGDDREGDSDFWRIDPNGDLYFYGFHKGKETSGLAGNRDNWLSDPVKAGGRNMNTGDEVTDVGQGSVWVKVGPFEQQISGQVTVTTRYTRRENVPTHMGVFNNCLRVEIDIVFAGVNIRGNTFWLKQGVGMVKQDQQPDANDAETHSIQSGNVGGTPITADGPPPPVVQTAAQ